MSLIAELRRRNVFRVAAAYLVVGWLLTEVLTTILPELGAPEWAARAVILIFAFGFIPAVVLSLFYEFGAQGLHRDHEVDRDDGQADEADLDRAAGRVDGGALLLLRHRVVADVEAAGAEPDTPRRLAPCVEGRGTAPANNSEVLPVPDAP